MSKLTMKEFQAQVGVSRGTIYNWINQGIVSDQMFEGVRMFDQDDLLKAPSVLGQEKEQNDID
jgi:predicted site-specific integrase-resolvase